MIVPKDLNAASGLAARYIGYCDPYYYNCNSPWHRWGRWVLAGVLILIALVFLAFFLLIGARRRRRSRYHTTTPMTTQPANGGYYGGQQPYNNNNQQYAAPAGAPPTYGNDQAYNGYYGQQGGVAEPQNVYQPPK